MSNELRAQCSILRLSDLNPIHYKDVGNVRDIGSTQGVDPLPDSFLLLETGGFP